MTITREREKELITLAQQGDRDAVADLCEAHRPLLWKLAYRVSKSWPMLSSIQHVPYLDEVETLVQHGYMSLMRAIELFDIASPYRLMSYASRRIKKRMLYEAMRYHVLPTPDRLTRTQAGIAKVIDHQRRTYSTTVDKDAREQVRCVPVKHDNAPLYDAEDVATLHKAIEYLSPIHQEVVGLLIAGYSRKEIAEIRGVSQQAVSQVVFAIIDKLPVAIQKVRRKALCRL